MENLLQPALKSGLGNIRRNISILMEPPVSQARKKAIVTIAKKNNIPRPDAQFRQAKHIAEYYSRKNPNGN